MDPNPQPQLKYQPTPLATPRPRPTKSCLVCRRRKVKCDRFQPSCSNCKAHGLHCEYASTEKKIRFIQSNPQSNPRGKSPTPQDHSQKEAKENPEEEGESLDRTQRSGLFGDGGFVCGVFWKLANDTSSEDVQNFLYNASKPTETIAVTITEALESLPPKHESDRFFECYIDSIHPIFPLLDIPQITFSYNTLYSGSYTSIEISELLLLVSLLYAGSQTRPSSYRAPLSAFYFTLLPRTSWSQSPTLKTLQAYTIFNSSNASESLPLTSFTFLPLAVRCAQSLGLHTEPPSPTERNLHRRLWWHLVYLDVEGSIANGLPRLIHQDDYDTQHPSYSELSPSMQLALSARLDWTVSMQRWLRRQPPMADVFAFEARCKKLASEATEPWARDYILLQMPRAGTILSHRVHKCHAREQKESMLWTHARGMLNLYLALAGCNRFMWFVPGLLHPLHAVVVLLMRKTPPSGEERELLERAFAVMGNTVVQGVLVPREIEIRGDDDMGWVYGMLGKLKNRVWEKEGWGGERGKGIEVAEIESDEMALGEFDWDEWDRMLGKFFFSVV
ncbi:hypothetical protein FPQ18DRAFT_374977 [Pyronema domesticum]|nr:hypothetical protein FPQ18DRAFT_374977 [Pyronema domesticum]